ncbi:tellurite resistance TerB family protein [Actinomadura sp. 1N219]|uniref:tellurite resistance TerB family protein n=1 Tax=Actinomadura sp. 1N219 TaxID=3375152 RepID=UPI00378CB196
MPFWDKLRESTQTMQTQLLSRKNDLKSGAFRDASMAMCALVAAADGSVDPTERQKTASLIASNEVLQNFPADDLQRRFNDNVSKLTADFDFGKVAVLQDIGKAKKKPAEARAVIQIGIIIGGADGNFDNSEKAIVREACYALGLDPAEFEL